MAKILVADDSTADLALMESILRSEAHQVITVSDPTEVEGRVAAERPDLVLLDVVMPGQNGYEVLRALRKNALTQGVKVVLVSSKGNDTDVRWGLRQGASEYVTKPYTPAQILDSVRRVVG
ncbi:response regulator [Deinococcus planocerae]|uniref:response regulator n=1 Tax=Deinococcus planocerae TaxID=1737569 RepID=UPI000C7ECFD0|nr:response regulator [Deinococcus planocerae]